MLWWSRSERSVLAAKPGKVLILGRGTQHARCISRCLIIQSCTSLFPRKLSQQGITGAPGSAHCRNQVESIRRSPACTSRPAAFFDSRWRYPRRLRGVSYDPSVTTKCFVTGSMIFQVPLKSASTTNASPGPTSTGAPPSGVMMMRPEIMWTNS